jgi:REP element-mobilizing transposase RayT
LSYREKRQQRTSQNPERHGYLLLTARIHDGDHAHLFVSAPPKVCVLEMVRVFKCVSAKMLFDEFPISKNILDILFFVCVD